MSGKWYERKITQNEEKKHKLTKKNRKREKKKHKMSEKKKHKMRKKMRENCVLKNGTIKLVNVIPVTEHICASDLKKIGKQFGVSSWCLKKIYIKKNNNK